MDVPKRRLLGLLGKLAPVLVLAAGLGGFVALGSRPAVKPETETETKAPLVEVVQAIAHHEGLEFEVDGVAVPFRELLLTAQVAGPIAFKADECQAGRFVKKGTLLLEIDPRDYQLEVQRLTRELKQAEGNLAEVDIETANTNLMLKLAGDDLALRQSELTRALRLLSRNVGTESEIEAAKRNELASRNSELTLKNELRLLAARRQRLEHANALVQTQLDKAELDQARTKILAPTDGVIVTDDVEMGTYVQPGATLVTLEDTAAVEVRCNLRMEELDWLWRQQDPTQVSAASDPVRADYRFPLTEATVIYELGGRRYAWNGMLARFDGIGLDERTRTMPCRVLVDKPRAVHLEGTSGMVSTAPLLAGPPALVRGMFVTVKIHAHPRATFLRLPELAVRPGNQVWRVRDGKLDRCPIQVARVTPEGVLIDAGRCGLAAGDQVVITPMTATPTPDGLGFVEEGQSVRVKPVESLAFSKSQTPEPARNEGPAL